MNTLTTSHTLQKSITALIEANPKLADSTKKQYIKTIRQYLDTGCNLTDVEALAQYAQNLNKSSRAFLKAVVRLWGEDVALKAKGQTTPENIAIVQATIYRIEALNEAVKLEVPKGQKAHIWLTQSEVKSLLDSCNTRTIQGKRDKIVLGLLVGAGLRREELVSLTFEQVLVQTIANRIRTVLNVKGKGAKDRAVPINDRLAAALQEWQAIVGGDYVARAISKGGAVGESLSAIGVFYIIRGAGEVIGKPELAPHDLRRTYAQLGYEAGVPITQISKLLGHTNVTTTQRYLNLDLDLKRLLATLSPFSGWSLKDQSHYRYCQSIWFRQTISL